MFTPGLEGVYTCVIDDDSGGVHVLSVGIYPHGFSGTPVLVTVLVEPLVNGNHLAVSLLADRGLLLDPCHL